MYRPPQVCTVAKDSYVNGILMVLTYKGGIMLIKETNKGGQYSLSNATQVTQHMRSTKTRTTPN
jgi:hypothetical protein